MTKLWDVILRKILQSIYFIVKDTSTTIVANNGALVISPPTYPCPSYNDVYFRVNVPMFFVSKGVELTIDTGSRLNCLLKRGKCSRETTYAIRAPALFMPRSIWRLLTVQQKWEWAQIPIIYCLSRRLVSAEAGS